LTVELTAPAAPVVVTETPKPQAASYGEIVAACVGADPAFICSQLAAGATVTVAQSAWMAEQNARIAAASQRPGVDPVGTKPSKPQQQQSQDTDAARQWHDAIRERMAAGMTQAQAARAVAVENPDLQIAFIAAHNAAVRNQ